MANAHDAAILGLGSDLESVRHLVGKQRVVSSAHDFFGELKREREIERERERERGMAFCETAILGERCL